MDSSQRLKLQEMIDTNNTINNTGEIRKLKHSSLIRQDVIKIQEIKQELNTDNYKTLDTALQSKCFFIFKNYTIIYNKLLKNNLDVNILYKFLDLLESVENGIQDQHEASYEIGMLLKKIYIDKQIDDSPQNNFIVPAKNITWNEYYNNT